MKINKVVSMFLLVVVCAASSLAAQTAMPLPAQTGSNTGAVAGYWFNAPTDFTITGLRVPTDASTAGQTIEVVRFASTPPFVFTPTNSFTQLYRVVNDTTTSVLSVSIPVSTGDIIGVLGYRGTTNSNATGPYSSSIGGVAFQMEVLGSNANLTTSAAHDLWRVSSGNSMGRIELYYSTTPAPPTSPSITSTAATSVTAGTQYSYQVAATGSPSPTYTISGTLPSWLTWDNVDTLTGTPSVSDAGTHGPFTIQASNSAGTDSEVFSINVIVAAVPEIDVTRSATSISDGGTDVLSNTGVSQFSVTYTVTNHGSQVLNLTGTPTVLLSNSVGCTTSLTSPAAATVPASGGTTTFTILITPTQEGSFSFDLSVPNNDGDENPYNIAFSGSTSALGSFLGGGGGSGSGCSVAISSTVLPFIILFIFFVARFKRYFLSLADRTSEIR